MKEMKKPIKIVTGANALENNAGILSGYGKCALIVTGPHVGKSDMIARLTASLDRDGVKHCLYTGITDEPTVAMIENGVRAYKENGCDFCIGIGGGSPLDSAKAIAAMVVNDGSIADYMGKEITATVPAVIAIPTTAGTGSEATKFTIITDADHDIKMLLKGDTLLPQLAIVDYTMGLTAPKSVTAATGLDALTHAVESYISVKACAETDALAIEAIKSIMKHLPVAYNDGSNLEAREAMAMAALNAGICINNSSVTVVHGMSRPIGALFHVPHGISNAMLLWVCMTDMREAAQEKFATLARATGVAEVGDDDATAAQAFIDALKNICMVCDVPTLAGYGIDESRFNDVVWKMAHDAIESGSPANAPKPYTAEDCVKLYKAAFK